MHRKPRRIINESVIRPDLLADHESAKQVALLLDSENEALHTRLAALVDENAKLRGESGPEQLALELRTLKELSAARAWTPAAVREGNQGTAQAGKSVSTSRSWM